MRGYVGIVHRGMTRDPKTGVERGKQWWQFFTDPFVYNVYWLPDGSKTIEQFALEQAERARKHVISDPLVYAQHVFRLPTITQEQS